jgi:Reverse transcriptase (RNA-dependent DNA polymerase)
VSLRMRTVCVLPLLWSLVIDELLTELAEQGYEVIGFADDLVIMIRENDDSILSNRLQSALNHAMKWCKEANLSITPMKTVAIPFTRRLKLSLKEPRISDETIKTHIARKQHAPIQRKKVDVFDFLHFHTRRAPKCPEESCILKILAPCGGRPKFPSLGFLSVGRFTFFDTKTPKL